MVEHYRLQRFQGFDYVLHQVVSLRRGRSNRFDGGSLQLQRPIEQAEVPGNRFANGGRILEGTVDGMLQ